MGGNTWGQTLQLRRPSEKFASPVTAEKMNDIFDQSKTSFDARAFLVFGPVLDSAIKIPSPTYLTERPMYLQITFAKVIYKQTKLTK